MARGNGNVTKISNGFWMGLGIAAAGTAFALVLGVLATKTGMKLPTA